MPEELELIPVKCQECGKQKPVYLIVENGFSWDGEYCKSCAEEILEKQEDNSS